MQHRCKHFHCRRHRWWGISLVTAVHGRSRILAFPSPGWGPAIHQIMPGRLEPALSGREHFVVEGFGDFLPPDRPPWWGTGFANL